MSNPIRDMEGGTIGYQDDDGTLRDKTNKKIGHITREGVVYDAHRVQVGSVNERGDVIDRYERPVGSINADGSVQDWHGIPVYFGSAAPLLIDFVKSKPEDPLPSRFDFERAAREAKTPQAEKKPLAILPEGFVSPSMIGCLGIVLAVVVGIGIMFVLQNPSALGRNNATPTLSALVGKTPDSNATNNTAVPDNAPKVTATPSEATGTVNTTILNLRQGPATSFEIVDRLQQDTAVTILGRLADSVWLKVSVPSIGKEGWVAAEYVNTTADVGTLEVIQPPSQ